MRTLEAGDVAPDFELKSMEGESRPLSRIVAGGPALLIFFKVTCPTCQLALPYLQRLAGGALQVIPVSQDDAARSAEFGQVFGVTLTPLLDDEEAGYPASNALGLTHVPSLFVIQPDRSISWSWVGFSRARYEELAALAGRALFTAADQVPESKYG